MGEAINKELQDKINAEFTRIDEKVTNLVKATTEEVQAFGNIGRENGEKLASLNSEIKDVLARILDLEQNAGGSGSEFGEFVASVGDQFVQSDAFAQFKTGANGKAHFEVQNNTITGSDTTVAPARRASVVPGATRNLRIAEVMPEVGTTSNAVEYVKEASFTNNASEQSSEGAAFSESGVTFSLVSVPIRTIGHFIYISKQMLDDGPVVAGYVNTRLAYGVGKREDSQLVVGDGTNGTISGLLDSGNYTAFAPTTGDDAIVSIRKAITQLELADYYPTAVLLNPAQVQAIDLDTASDGHYTMSNPRNMPAPMIWGLPIVASNAVTSGQFVIGAFDMACILHRRQGTIVEMSESDGDNFRKNVVTVRATVRAALEVNTPAAIVGGALTI